MKKSRGFTLLESVFALSLLGILFFLAYSGSRSFKKNAEKMDASLDQLQAMQGANAGLERDVRECREVLFPPMGGAPSRALMLRNFEGRIVCWYYLPATRELRRAVMDLAGAASETGWAPRKDLDGVYFTTVQRGNVSWGIFGPGTVLLGAGTRENL